MQGDNDLKQCQNNSGKMWNVLKWPDLLKTRRREVAPKKNDQEAAVKPDKASQIQIFGDVSVNYMLQ